MINLDDFGRKATVSTEFGGRVINYLDVLSNLSL